MLFCAAVGWHSAQQRQAARVAAVTQRHVVLLLLLLLGGVNRHMIPSNTSQVMSQVGDCRYTQDGISFSNKPCTCPLLFQHDAILAWLSSFPANSAVGKEYHNQLNHCCHSCSCAGRFLCDHPSHAVGQHHQNPHSSTPSQPAGAASCCGGTDCPRCTTGALGGSSGSGQVGTHLLIPEAYTGSGRRTRLESVAGAPCCNLSGKGCQASVVLQHSVA